MFTGIIKDKGEVVAIDKKGDWLLTIASALPLEVMPLGASVACNGICLTVVEKNKTQFKVQVSPETLSRTTALHWRPGTRLNLEPALRVGDEWGGHIVSGHIDGVARLREQKTDGDSLRCQFEAPQAYASFIAAKGSIALDGVSLTVNDAEKGRFDVVIIPYTCRETTLGALKAGAEVNFEIDILARYVGQWMKERTP